MHNGILYEELPDDRITLDRKTTMKFTDKILHYIEINCLADIKDVFENLHPYQCLTILNNTIDQITVLSSAILHNRVEISRYLLELSLLQGRQEMSKYWQQVYHPLTAAMDAGNIKLIELISWNLHDINEYSSGPYTPLMHAIFSGILDYVELMVRLGSDANRPCFHGRRPLMASVEHKDICEYLITLGVDLNHQDEDGNTALHLAVISLSIDCIKIIVDAGANVQIRNKEGITPLILASIKMKPSLVTDLSQHPTYSEIDKIEALEVLYASHTCTGHSVPSHSIQSFQRRKLKYNSRPSPSKGILNLSKELEFKDDPLSLAFQGIFIIGRLFGINSSIYLQFLLQTGQIAKKRDLLKTRQIIRYIDSNYRKSSAALVAACCQDFKNFFMEFFAKPDPLHLFPNGGFFLFKKLAQATGQMWLRLMDEIHTSPYSEQSPYVQMVDTFIYMGSAMCILPLSKDHRDQLTFIVYDLLQLDPRFAAQESLLHRAIKIDTVPTRNKIEFIRLLLASGACVDSRDSFRRTPLMYALIYTSDTYLLEIVELLKEWGCRLDYKDKEGFAVTDYKRWMILTENPPNPSEFKCQGRFLNYHIRYGRILPIVSVRPWMSTTYWDANNFVN